MATSSDKERCQNIDVQALLKKPILQMTGEEFLKLSNMVAQQAAQLSPLPQPAATDSTSSNRYDEQEYVFGLRGIGQLFGVAKTTAQYYKNTFLKPAIIQNGQRIVINRHIALQLYAEYMQREN